jgi:hypothetical protein
MGGGDKWDPVVTDALKPNENNTNVIIYTTN